MSQTIVVDTENLAKKAARLLELSGIFGEMGARMSRECLGVPSYAGQLEKPARQTAAQVLYETGVMKAAFRTLGDDLEKVADQFEATDQTSIEYWIKFYSDACQWSINILKYFFFGADSIDGDMIHGYKNLLAYYESGTIVTIWYNGRPLSIDLADPSLSPEQREALRKKLEAFRQLMQEALAHIRAALGGDEKLFLLALGMLGTNASIKDIIDLLLKLGLSVGKIPDAEKELAQAEEDIRQAGSIWEELNSQDLPGKVPTV